MWQYQNTDELYHYGVLGMKWGMRRAYNKGVEYQYKSHAQKKYEKKVEKLSSKIASKDKKPSFSTKTKLDKAKVKLEKYKGRDKNRQDYAKTASVGKSAVKTILFGPLGSGNYNRFRSSGHGRLVSALGSNYIASTLGYPVTALISKSVENKNGRMRAIADGNITKKTNRKQINNLYNKYHADDIHGVLKNMPKDKLNKIPKNILNGEAHDIENYLKKHKNI